MKELVVVSKQKWLSSTFLPERWIPNPFPNPSCLPPQGALGERIGVWGPSCEAALPEREPGLEKAAFQRVKDAETDSHTLLHSLTNGTNAK